MTLEVPLKKKRPPCSSKIPLFSTILNVALPGYNTPTDMFTAQNNLCL